MSDVVVTVPLAFGLRHWVEEGDPAGEPWSGTEWGFYLGGNTPRIAPGERVYVVYNGKLRGYSPLIRIERVNGKFALVRGGGAVACTIDRPIRGFQGWRYRSWAYEDERPFPDWASP